MAAIVWVLWLFVGLTRGQTVLLSKCPKKETEHVTFDHVKMDGTWYEMERSSLLVEFPLKCVSVSIQRFYDNQATFTFNAFHRILKKKVAEKGTLTLSRDFPSSGKLNQSIDAASWGQHMGMDNYTLQVLATDYKQYLILWACKDFSSNSHSEALWLWSRDPKWPGNHSQWNGNKMKEKLRALQVSHLKLEVSPRNKCKSERKRFRSQRSPSL